MKLLLVMIFFAWFVGGAIVSYPADAAESVYAPGETIRYQIKKLGLKVGDAVLEYRGLIEEEGRQYILLIFTADGFNFYDQEKIYADPQTLLPVRVERDLNIFGNKEKISEYYDQTAFEVRIVKPAKDGNGEEQILKKQGVIDNLYCFIYRYRSQGVFEVGKILTMSLPTKNVELKIARKADIKIGSESRSSFLMESIPSEYRVWFWDEEARIPLRIDGAVGFAKTQMIFAGYEPGRGSIKQ